MGLKPFYILAASLAVTQGVAAQQRAADTVLKGSTIEVIQSYKPQVRKAPKPEWLPQLPPADTTRPVLTYEVPQQILYYSYTSGALRPLALGRDSMVMPFQNYVKAGGGNLSTLYFDAGIGSLKGKNYETGIHLHHISQKGSLANQQSALSGVEADGVLHKDNRDWHAFAQAERNQYYFYGIEPITVIGPTQDLKQAFTLVKIGGDMFDRSQTGIGKWQYHPYVSGSLYSARFNNRETEFDVNAPISYPIDSVLTLEGLVSASIVNYKFGGLSSKNNFAQLKPGVAINKGKLSGHALLGLGLGSGSTFYALPDIAASYNIAAINLTLTGGWMASVRQNTYQQLTTENPYMWIAYPPTTGAIMLPQTRIDEIFAEIKGIQGKHLSYEVKASWWNFNKLATFLNIIDNPIRYSVVYDDVSAISLHMAARYVSSNVWSAGASADFYKFYQGSQAYVWGQPTLNIKGDVSVSPIKKLSLSGYVAILGGIYAINHYSKPYMLTPVTDLGVYGEYNITDRLSAFLQCSNLLNAKYERWRGYQTYGLNVYGGLRLKF